MGDPKLSELLSDLREAHSAVVRSDRTLQQALRVAEEAHRDFENAVGLLELHVTSERHGEAEKP